eukprot:TRINITY_DN9100_c0_g1_i1.p1 TRINITY_DN9100_c0_g1~~TRINITY_DN9100_c0_g1_i1.p1  ORF type:complete len:206 (-),score=-4.52 TRINITY_DN9100_c0_g1_i1:186-803(-)
MLCLQVDVFAILFIFKTTRCFCRLFCSCFNQVVVQVDLFFIMLGSLLIFQYVTLKKLSGRFFLYVFAQFLVVLKIFWVGRVFYFVFQCSIEVGCFFQFFQFVFSKQFFITKYLICWQTKVVYCRYYQQYKQCYSAQVSLYGSRHIIKFMGVFGVLSFQNTVFVVPMYWRVFEGCFQHKRSCKLQQQKKFQIVAHSFQFVSKSKNN